MTRRRAPARALLRALLVASLASAAACSADPAPDAAPSPAPTADRAASEAPLATVTPARQAAIARRCADGTSGAALDGPREGAERDLDLQFHWRSATACQDLHELEARARFGPLENLTVRAGVGHRVLLLLPSQGGVASVARYRVRLADAPAAALVAWLTLERAAAPHSDGISFAVGVAPVDEEPDAVPLAWRRLTREEAEAGWTEVRVDLAPWRGREVWLVLAARDDGGDRRGDWLLWGDPRVVLAEPRAAEIDLSAGVTEIAATTATTATPVVPWSEVNVFKAYSGFNEDEAARLDPRWLAQSFPWVDSLRLFASLGGSWGPALARDYESQMGHNPSRDSRDERRWAEHYEFFHDGPGWEGRPLRERFDWRRYDALLARIATTGARLHVNLAGAPELFTGARGHYHTYHFNEMPVVDEQGWKVYVDQVFAHLSAQAWFPRARFSFFSEPNSVWIDADGSVRRFGYQGDARQYARQYLWTWQAMRPYVAPGQVHLGPFVVEPDDDRLPDAEVATFLREIRAAFAATGEPLPPWSAFAINVYESPRTSIDHFTPAKIAPARRALRDELPAAALPLRIDEVGLHPLLVSAFGDAGVAGLEGSRWAAAWHAEMLALLVTEGIETGSPWLHAELLRPYGTYALASLASGTVVGRRTPDGKLSLERRADGSLSPERRADGDAGAAAAPPTGAAPQPAARPFVRLASASADRVGALAWPDARVRTTRLLLWHLPRFPTSDDALAATIAPARARIRLPGCEGAGCRVVVLGYADQPLAASGDPARSPVELTLAGRTDLPPLRREERVVRGEVEVDFPPGAVYLIEVRHAPAGRSDS